MTRGLSTPGWTIFSNAEDNVRQKLVGIDKRARSSFARTSKIDISLSTYGEKQQGLNKSFRLFLKFLMIESSIWWKTGETRTKTSSRSHRFVSKEFRHTSLSCICNIKWSNKVESKNMFEINFAIWRRLRTACALNFFFPREYINLIVSPGRVVGRVQKR